MRAYWALVVVLAACGNPAASGDDTMIDGGGDGSMGDAGDGWTTLIARKWTQLPASQSFRCRRIKIQQDMYISEFRAITPTGTHHEIVSLSPDTTSSMVGDFDCTPTALSNNPGMLYGAGIGTPVFTFPPGVAIKLAAGTYIQLYVHVYNASDADLTETSGVEVKLANAADVVHEADMNFGGKFSFSIPSTNTPVHIVGDCAGSEDWHVVGLWPHMHEHGIHQQVAVRRAGVIINTLLDADYDYNNQVTYPMDMTVKASDRLGFDCTFLNNTGTSIGASDGENGEMCFTGFYKWPAGVVDPYYCTNP